MMGIISDALDELLQSQNKTLTTENRIDSLKDKIGTASFRRKDYLNAFKNISAPTASRDLAWAVKENLLNKKKR